MIPVVLDPAKTAVALVGRGQLAVKRLAWLRGLDARPTVYSDRPDSALSAAAGGGLVRRLPGHDDLVGLHALWIADLPEMEARPVVEAARRRRLLVNLEDQRESCDFHNPAVVRRGDLLLGISTGGKSPGLASRLRRTLEQVFGPEWEERLEELAARREDWKSQPNDLSELARLTDELIDSKGWLTARDGGVEAGQ